VNDGEPGMCLVRSNRSNPALKQGLAKARFSWKIFFDCGIKSAAVYAAKAKKRSGYFSRNQWLTAMQWRCRPCFWQNLSRNLRQIRMN